MLYEAVFKFNKSSTSLKNQTTPLVYHLFGTRKVFDLMFKWDVRRHGDTLMGRRHYVPMRRRHDKPIKHWEDVPLRRRWVFHLRRTYDVAGAYRETPLQHRHDILLPGGYQVQNWTFSTLPTTVRYRSLQHLLHSRFLQRL